MAEKNVQEDTLKKKTLEAKEKAENLKENIGDKTSKTKDKAIEVKKGALEKTLSAKDKALDKTLTAKDKALDKTLSAKDKALMKTSQMKEDASAKTSELTEEASEKKVDLKENADKTRKQAERKINEFISSLRDKQGELGKTLSDYTAAEKPLTDLINGEDSFIIKSDLPGISKDDIIVHITEDSVDLKVKFDDENEDVEFIKKERNYGEINRIIKLPDLVEVKKASAKFEDSVLTIDLPKVKEDKIRVEIK
jgi:HSP20 family protein